MSLTPSTGRGPLAFPVCAALAIGLATLTLGGSAQQPAGTGEAAAPARLGVSAPTRASANLAGVKSSRLATIQGNALNSQNGPLASGLVRLRDARFGRATSPQPVGASGAFEFRGVEPGTYVVELVDPNSRVLATSPLVSADTGQVVSTLVRMPFRIPAVGFTVPQAIAAVMTAAASAGVLTSVVPEACVSGPCH